MKIEAELKWLDNLPGTPRYHRAVAALRREVLRLRKDKERVDFLQDQKRGAFYNGMYEGWGLNGADHDPMRPEWPTLRNAIDAARKPARRTR